MANINNQQCEEWLRQISENVHQFRKKHRMNVADKQKFLNEQYYLLHLIVRAIQGKVRFVGTPVIKDRINSDS